MSHLRASGGRRAGVHSEEVESIDGQALSILLTGADYRTSAEVTDHGWGGTMIARGIFAANLGLHTVKLMNSLPTTASPEH